MCDVSHHKSYILVLIAVTEVRKRIFYILDGIIVLFRRWFYDIMRLVAL